MVIAQELLHPEPYQGGKRLSFGRSPNLLESFNFRKYCVRKVGVSLVLALFVWLFVFLIWGRLLLSEKKGCIIWTVPFSFCFCLLMLACIPVVCKFDLKVDFGFQYVCCLKLIGV
jgi:hypothetical protein